VTPAPESAADELETDPFTDEQQLFSEVEIETFVLKFLEIQWY